MFPRFCAAGWEVSMWELPTVRGSNINGLPIYYSIFLIMRTVKD